MVFSWRKEVDIAYSYRKVCVADYIKNVCGLPLHKNKFTTKWTEKVCRGSIYNNILINELFENIYIADCEKKTIRYAYGSGELSAMYQKNSS